MMKVSKLAWCYYSVMFLILCAAPGSSKLRGRSGMSHHHQPSQDYFESEENKLSLRYRGILGYSQREPLINFVSPQEFIEYVVRLPRNYTVVVLFNSDPMECSVSEGLHDLMENFAVHYAEMCRGETQSVFFVEMVQNEVPKIFNLFNMETVPNFIVFGPRGKLSNLTLFDHERYRIHYDTHVQEWLRAVTNTVTIPHQASIFNGRLHLVHVITPVFLLIAYVHRDTLIRILSERSLVAYAAVCVFTILSSGHIFNYIEGPAPFWYDDPDSIQFIARTEGYQFLIEAYIITCIYAAVAFGSLGIIEGRRLELLEKKEEGRLVSASSCLVAGAGFICLHYVTSLK